MMNYSPLNLIYIRCQLASLAKGICLITPRTMCINYLLASSATFSIRLTCHTRNCEWRCSSIASSILNFHSEQFHTILPKNWIRMLGKIAAIIIFHLTTKLKKKNRFFYRIAGSENRKSDQSFPLLEEWKTIECSSNPALVSSYCEFGINTKFANKLGLCARKALRDWKAIGDFGYGVMVPSWSFRNHSLLSDMWASRSN